MSFLSNLANTATGGLVGGIFGLASANHQAAANREMVELQNRLNVDNYKHRYQWAMDDMRDSGLNPILAATQGIGGNIAGASALALQDNSGLSAVGGMSAAAANQQANSAAALIKSQTEKNNADAAAATASAAGMGINNKFLSETYNRRLEQLDVQVENLRKSGRNIDSDTYRKMFDAEVVMPSISAMNLSNAVLASNTASLRRQEELTERARTEQVNLDNYYKSLGAGGSNYVDSAIRLSGSFGRHLFNSVSDRFSHYKDYVQD